MPIGICMACALWGASALAAAPPVLTLADAVALVLQKNPELAAYAWDIRAAEARELQARLHPNPEVSLELEDIPLGESQASTPLTSPDPLPVFPGLQSTSTEFTVSLSQVIELGGKRAKRMALAARDRDVAAWDYEITRADILRDVAQAFAVVLAAQDHLMLDEELVQLAEQVLRSVAARVEAGRVSPLDATKAETALASAHVERDRSKRALTAARIRLAALWGDTEARFERAAGDLACVRPIPEWETLTRRVDEVPDVSRWQSELAKRDTTVKVEQSKAVSDVRLNLGFRRTATEEYGTHEHGGENALVVGLSVPLPLFNRNQGAIKEAEHLAAKARDEKRAVEVRVGAALAAVYQELCGAYATVASLKERILPAAAQTFDAVNEAYKQGKFGYLDVLDAQRTLFDARQTYLEALADYHRNVAELERLFGASLWENEASTPTSHKEKHGNE